MNVLIKYPLQALIIILLSIPVTLNKESPNFSIDVHNVHFVDSFEGVSYIVTVFFWNFMFLYEYG